MERYAYSAYGRPEVYDASFSSRSSSSYDWETLYAGYRYDESTGLRCVRHRYLNPRLGKWINRDPAGYKDARNLYLYLNNDPIGLRDPSGLGSFGDWVSRLFSSSKEREAMKEWREIKSGACYNKHTGDYDINRYWRGYTKSYLAETRRNQRFLSTTGAMSVTSFTGGAAIYSAAPATGVVSAIGSRMYSKLQIGAGNPYVQEGTLGAIEGLSNTGTVFGTTVGAVTGAGGEYIGNGVLSKVKNPFRKKNAQVERIQSIYKAPQPGKGKILMDEGLQPIDFQREINLLTLQKNESLLKNLQHIIKKEY